jgi:molecular chaperone DnaK
MGIIIGIDFGTTKTVAAFIKDGRPIIIPDRQGHLSMPSLVLVTPEEEHFAGWEAQTHPYRYNSKHVTINSIKRSLGKEGESGWGTWKTQPQEVAALILGRMKIEVEEYLGEEINDAVIAIPAHFDINQRLAIKQAGRIAGFNVRRLQSEATAALLTHHTIYGHSVSNILAFDFGGGALDVSILTVGDGVCEVKAVAGDGKIGGDDFDQVICDYILESAQKRIGDSDRLNSSQQIILRESAIRAKAELSVAESSRIFLPGFFWATSQKYCDLDTTLTRNTFFDLSKSLLSHTEKVLRQAISAAHVDKYDDVLLIGGSSRIPAVRDVVRGVLGREPRFGIDPESAVAQGAGILGGVLSGKIKDMLLLDVFPKNLSVATDDGVLSVLIERNTTTPTRKSQIFTTTVDNQIEISVSVYEGEGLRADQDVFVGRLTLSGIPQAPHGVPRIEVTLDIDANHILHVSAKDLGTGREASALLKAPLQLNDEQVTVMGKKVFNELAKVKKMFTAYFIRLR